MGDFLPDWMWGRHLHVSICTPFAREYLHVSICTPFARFREVKEWWMLYRRSFLGKIWADLRKIWVKFGKIAGDATVSPANFFC